MGLADELTRLEELKGRGALTEAEFQRAKARLLDGPPSPPDIPAVAAISRWRRPKSIIGWKFRSTSRPQAPNAGSRFKRQRSANSLKIRRPARPTNITTGLCPCGRRIIRVRAMPGAW